MADLLNFSGVPVFMNGRDYIIPSLSLRQVQENYEKLANAASALEASVTDPSKTVVDAFNDYLPIIGMAVRRNYPEVTDDNLGDWLDTSNFSEVLIIVQSLSGFKASKTGEAQPAK